MCRVYRYQIYGVTVLSYVPTPLLADCAEASPPLPCYVLLVPDGLSRLAAERQSHSLLLCEALRETGANRQT